MQINYTRDLLLLFYNGLGIIYLYSNPILLRFHFVFSFSLYLLMVSLFPLPEHKYIIYFHRDATCGQRKD